LLASSAKPSAARTPKTAAELEMAQAQAKKKDKDAQTDSSAGTSGEGLRHPATEANGADRSATSGNSRSASTRNNVNKEEVAALEPPPLLADQASSALKGVLSSQGLVPTLSPQRVSRGVSGGELIHCVPPVYPTQAKTLRVEGKVVLDATVMEDGTVGDLKVVQGEPALIGAALDAVKKWRYKPFMLDTKAIKSPMRITVDFKLPR
jgi:TonB family protein